MSEIKLLPCPFCGGEAHIEEHKFWNDRTKSFTVGTYGVRCLKCGASGTQFHKTKEEAIELWNTRKPMERIIERLEESADQSIKIGDVYGFSATNEAIFVVKEEGGIE